MISQNFGFKNKEAIADKIPMTAAPMCLQTMKAHLRLDLEERLKKIFLHLRIKAHKLSTNALVSDFYPSANSFEILFAK